MAYPVYMVPAGDVLPIMFDTFDGGTGASITMSGLAVTDIEIYKDGSVTQRASDAGYTLLDTDGIDFDGLTGIHGFSIDTGDNTDASFYTTGAWFHVVVSAITVDAQTVSFIAAAFRIVAAESSAGVPKADVSHWLGTATATPTVAGVPEVDLTHVAGATTDVSALATNVAAILVDTGTTLDGRIPAALVGGRMDANVGAISADTTAADNLENAFDDTAGPVPWMGIVEQGTAQSATATTLVGRAAGAVADDAFNGCVMQVLGSTQGYWQTVTITDTTLSNDTFTVGGWPGATPSGTITYRIFGSPNSSTSPIAANITQVAGSTTDVASLATNVAAILVDTGTTLDARIPAALVSGRMDASVGAMAANVVTASAVADGAIDAATFAADVDAEILSYIVDDATRIDASSLNTAAVTTIPAILVDTGTTLDGLITTVDTVVDGIKAKTDSLTFTVAGKVDSNITHVIADPVITNGSTTTEWGGT